MPLSAGNRSYNSFPRENWESSVFHSCATHVVMISTLLMLEETYPNLEWHIGATMKNIYIITTL